MHEREPSGENAIPEFRCRHVVDRPHRCMPEHSRRSQRGISKRTAARAIWIQGENGDHARTAAARKRTSPGQGFHRRIQRKNVFVYPTATKDRILVGNQTQYNAYKQAVVAYGLTTSPDFVQDTHGRHRILIQEFNGFGPLGE